MVARPVQIAHVDGGFRFQGLVDRGDGARGSVNGGSQYDLRQHIDQARDACARALSSAGIAAAIDFLANRLLPPERCLALLRETARREKVVATLLSARNAAQTADGLAGEPAAVERALLVQAARQRLDCIADLPVDASVKHLLCGEFIAYAAPPRGSEPRFAIDTQSFIAMSRIVTGLRFPGGLFDWEVSGYPRSWFLKLPARLIGPTVRFLTFRTKGIAPFLVWHLAGTVHRHPFLLESDSRKSFYRMAAAAERQPHVKGLMAASWLLSSETLRVSPHLEFIRRPFLEAGGIYTEAGPAHVSNGFLTGDMKRKKLYEAGRYKPTVGVVLCSRDQAIRWIAEHRDLEGLSEMPST